MRGRVRSVVRHAKRVVITVVGLTIVLGGIALLVLPGPGWMVIIAGLAILAAEYVWARRLLEKTKEQAKKGAKAVGSGLKRPFRRKVGAAADTADVSRTESE